MKKTLSLLVSSVALLAVTGGALNASEQIAKYDNLNHVVNPDGKKAYVLNYVETADGKPDKKLTINIPELPYKASFNLCPNVEEADKCKGSVFVRKNDAEFLVDYNVVFLDSMKDKKPAITQIESTEVPMALNVKSDEEELFLYQTLSVHNRYWMLKNK
ncbi:MULTISPECIES: hypothetical protein [Sulfurospirillum]|uniref:Ecotin n=4 Tax=Sulfurospirillum TaxID=57665 RepID=A0A1Y0HNL1_9BACT|nr:MULTISPECIES: hypothetical protein [Sulfurospirillum]AHJ12846.1 hypothetical protein SMUL_1586 [Sulfurospirillum multivorans DSM 12446]AOO65322.1 hypothetical protein SHALO_1547 [Sulfurospirillum halorespirans DSM 13726]ARU48803.1 hypothetical protein Sdiek1_1640 [Sulfurospirillum diekertiae]ASC93624.1 hypothetical protein Sdiek2_1606 [Sulfurospirillum diekertiae]ATB69668.1 hypothetical protein SJPD1_1559 [Sulfurospirillum diekertiae]